jgi:CDP-paratose 2-epimerase
MSSAPRWTLITGGAGFIGVNLADRLAAGGGRVLIYDSLSRPGVDGHLNWLCDTHGDLIQAEIADINNRRALRAAVREAAAVYHCAAQVAVTTSIHTPDRDFEVNARGTLNLLEALRSCSVPPPLLFTSTNKVYGRLTGIELQESELRVTPVRSGAAINGISEEQSLDFYSPYGCSKGAADQYVLDYARIYGLPGVVFRMSCIYGPHQLGTEDQGWVAHFLIRALKGEPITIYGSGKQVRDLLYIDDLLNAFRLAMAHMDHIRGRVFNIGGGAANAVSLLEFLELIKKMHGGVPEIRFGPWRPGDQPYYVSATTAFQQATGWRPQANLTDGLARLYAFLKQREEAKAGNPHLQAATMP